ncbi:MAG: MFS transporter [Anaerolineae bacterium]|nr:MFS transporter [Anaerolineae bacterium]
MQPRHARLRYQIIAFALARLAINTGHRMIYPFLPTIARGLNVERTVIAQAVSVRSALGFFSPIFGALANRRGSKIALLIGAGLFTAAMALVTISPTYPALVAALVIASAGKLIYDPAVQVYLGERVHYTQRGFAIAITELSWSGAFLIGMPVIGWLIDRSGQWQAPFPLLTALGIAAIILLWLVVPPEDSTKRRPMPLMQGIRLVLAHPPALAGLATGFFISASNETISIIYGAWLEDAFAMQVTALGLSALVIGIAELAGESSVAGFVDRIGKRRAVALGIGSNALAALLLPVFGSGQIGALIGLFLFFITFEFALVSSLPLMTELLPAARATLMAGNVTAYSGGRMLGALIGDPLFTMGLLANCTTAAIFDILALMALLLFIRQE